MKTKKITPIQERLIALAKDQGSRLFRLQDQGFIRLDQWDHDRLTWDREDIADLWFEPVFLSYGDYNNSSTVERSNHRVFIEKYGKLKGIDTFTGSYSFNSILISIENFKSIEAIETLEKLSDYPLIDDSDLSELEIEIQNESYDRDYRSDFIKGIREYLEQGIEDSEFNDLDLEYARELLVILENQEDLTDSANDRIFSLFRVFEDVTNTYWIHEDPFSAYIDIDRMIEGIGSPIGYSVTDSACNQVKIPRLSLQGILKIVKPEYFSNPNQLNLALDKDPTLDQGDSVNTGASD